MKITEPCIGRIRKCLLDSYEVRRETALRPEYSVCLDVHTVYPYTCMHLCIMGMYFIRPHIHRSRCSWADCTCDVRMYVEVI